MHKTFGVFLSHYKFEAAAEARILKLELVRSLRTKEEEVFLDADNLTNLKDLLLHVENSDAVALLYTKGVLCRPWCLLELYTAVERSVPIFIVRVANAFAGDLEEISSILDDLPKYLADTNPTASETLRALKYDVSKIAASLKPALCAGDGLEIVNFDPHQGSAMLHAEIGQIAHALVRLCCPQNEPLLIDFESAGREPWPVKRRFPVYIVHEEQSPKVVEQVRSPEWFAIPIAAC